MTKTDAYLRYGYVSRLSMECIVHKGTLCKDVAVCNFQIDARYKTGSLCLALGMLEMEKNHAKRKSDGSVR